MSDSALVARPEQPLARKDALERLQQRYQKLQEKDLDVVKAMNRFAELPSFVEETARAELIALLAEGSDLAIQQKYGFKDKRELRMALYGTLPKKDWPAAMQAAHERVLARQRKQSQQAPRNVLNLNMITIPAPRKPTDEDKVIVVEPERG